MLSFFDGRGSRRSGAGPRFAPSTPRAGRRRGCRLLIEVSLAVYEHMFWSVVVRLSGWAEGGGVHCQTAWRWFGDGQLPVPAVRTPSGTILVGVPRSGVAGGAVRTVL
jgi:hypothetical protein